MMSAQADDSSDDQDVKKYEQLLSNEVTAELG